MQGTAVLHPPAAAHRGGSLGHGLCVTGTLCHSLGSGLRGREGHKAGDGERVRVGREEVKEWLSRLQPCVLTLALAVAPGPVALAMALAMAVASASSLRCSAQQGRGMQVLILGAIPVAVARRRRRVGRRR